MLITYDDTCVQGAWNLTVEGWGFEEYNWSTNSIDVGPDDVFAPAADGAALPNQISGLGSPVINGDSVSLCSSQCTQLYGACSAGVVQEATFPAPTANLENPNSYSSLVTATTNGGAAFEPMAISVASYPGVPYQMIEETSVGGTYDIFSSQAPSGPWQLETIGTAPGCAALTLGFCYALEGHPELSTSWQIAMSYYDPQAGPLGPDGPVGHIVGTFVPLTDPAPAVGQISPSQGPSSGGTTVTIDGANFSTTPGGTSVTFGSTPASSVTCASTTQCTAVSPAGSGTVTVSVTVGSATSTPVPAGQFGYQGATLTSGSVLANGQMLQNGPFSLVMQSNGDLVEYVQEPNGSSYALWDTGTQGNANDGLYMDPDGDVTVQSPQGQVLWSSGSGGAGSSLVLWSNGAVFTANAAGLNWGIGQGPSSGNFPSPDTTGSPVLQAGKALFGGESITTGSYQLAMQNDGNLVVSNTQGQDLWSSGTQGDPGDFLIMQSDGNLIIYSKYGNALWATGTEGNPGDYAVMQSTDGNLVVYSSTQALWPWRTGLIN